MAYATEKRVSIAQKPYTYSCGKFSKGLNKKRAGDI